MLDFAIKQNGSKKSLFEKKKIPHLEAKKNASADNLKKKKNQMKERQTRYLEVNENENPVCQNLTVKSVQKKKNRDFWKPVS